MSQDDGAPPETAEALLARLRGLIGEGRLEIRIDPRPLLHVDSPVASEADGNLWVYGAIAVSGALLLWRGVWPALAAALVGVVLYLTLGRAYVHRRLERRVREEALASLDAWRRVWRFRGLTLVAAGRPEIAPCASPDGNWMGFVRRADSLPERLRNC